jgi:outer membrane protein assembly factor BamB
MANIEIKIGENWKRDPEYLRILRGDEHRADLYAIHDTIDIITDGLALTQRLSQDSIVYLLHDLALGLLALLRREKKKVFITFYDHPYELVISQHGADARLSFYSISGAQDVVIKDCAVNFASFASQVSTHIERMHRELLKINPNLHRDPFLEGILTAAKELRGILQEKPLRAFKESKKTYKKQSSRSFGADLHDEFVVSFWFDKGDPCLLSYQPESPSDLHSLLCAGQLVLSGNGLLFQSQEGYPILFLESLVSAAHQLITAMERGETRPHFVLQLQKDKLFGALTEEGLSLTTPNQEHARASIPLSDFIEEVVCSAREFAYYVKELSPSQEKNERLSLLLAEAEDVEAAFAELSIEPVVNTEMTEFRLATQYKSPAEDIDDSLSGLRRLGFTQKLSLEADQLSLLGVTSKMLVVAGEDKLIGFERSYGRRAWQIEKPGATFFLSEIGALLWSKENRVGRLDPTSGQPVWETRVEGSNASIIGAPLYFERAGRRRVFFLSSDRRFLCLDVTSGKLCFTIKAPRRGGTFFAFSGKLVYACCEDGSVIAMHADSGEQVFRYKTRQKFFTAPFVSDDLLLCTASINGDARLIALQPFSGELCWERSIGSSLDAAPLVTEGSAFVVSRTDQSLQAVKISLTDGAILWAQELINGSNRAASPVLIHERLFVIDDAGVLRSVLASDGSDVQHIDLGAVPTGPSYLPPAPLFYKGLLLVAADTLYALEPSRSGVIGRIIECPAAPEKFFLREDGEIILATDNEFIASYRISAQLGLV